jgi:hypothetical protein
VLHRLVELALEVFDFFAVPQRVEGMGTFPVGPSRWCHDLDSQS